MHAHVIELQPARLEASLTAANAPSFSPGLQSTRSGASLTVRIDAVAAK